MSTRSLKASFIFDMQGNMARKSRQVVDGFRRMGRTGDAELGRIGRAADAANRKLNAGIIRGSQAAGLAIGAAAVLSARRMFTLEERLERLGIAAGKTPKEMMAVRDAVNEVANLPNIKIDPGEILSGMEAFTEATGRFDLADEMKKEMALAIQATGSGGEEIGKLMASIFQKFDIKTPDEMMAAIDTLAVQGKAGAVELSNLAVLGPKVFSAFRRFGEGGVGGMAEAGGLMQKFKEGVGSPEEAATVFENVLNNMYNPTKMKKLRRAGVEMEDADGNLKGPADLIKAVITSAGGNDLNLAKVFDAEAMRGFSILSAEYRATGGFGSLDSLSAIRGDGSVIEADSARLAEVGNSTGQALLNNVNDRIEDNLMEPLKELAKSLNALLDKGIKFTMEDAANVAAGGVAAFGLAKAGLWMLGGGRRRGRAPGGGGLLGGALDVTPVFVTNMPPGGMGGLGDGPGRRGNRGPGGKGRVLGPNGLPLERGTGGGGRTGGGTGGGGRRPGRLGRTGRLIGFGGSMISGGGRLLAGGARAAMGLSPVGVGVTVAGVGAGYGYGKLEDYGDELQRQRFEQMRNDGSLPNVTADDIAMARRKRELDQMMHGAAPIAQPAPPLMTGGETAADLSAKLEALLLAEEDTREETQVSGDKVVRAVTGLGDRLDKPVKPMPLSGILMSQP